jgi:hypothetical protein
MAKPKYKSRAKRWEEAIEKARKTMQLAQEQSDTLAETIGQLDQDMEDLRSIQEEYEGWFDSLNEGLQAGGTGQMLEAIKDLDLKPETPDMPSLSEYESALDYAEATDLPVPFRAN